MNYHYSKAGNDKLKAEKKLRCVYSMQVTEEEFKKLEYIRLNHFVGTRTEFIEMALVFYIKNKYGMDFEFRPRFRRLEGKK